MNSSIDDLRHAIVDESLESAVSEDSDELDADLFYLVHLPQCLPNSKDIVVV